MISGVFGHESEPAWAILPGSCQSRQPIMGDGGNPCRAKTYMQGVCICATAGRGMPMPPMIGLESFPDLTRMSLSQLNIVTFVKDLL